jgi:hypothetical protein
MRKRVLLAALTAGALLVAPVAGADAKPDGDDGGTKAKKCEKPRLVGFKVKGTLVAGSDLATIDVALITANRHARAWLAENVPGFVLGDSVVDLDDFVVDDQGDEKIKFVGVTDDVAPLGVLGFEDAVGDRVKVKAKLELLKHGCPAPVLEEDTVLEDDAVDVRKVKVKATDTD